MNTSSARLFLAFGVAFSLLLAASIYFGTRSAQAEPILPADSTDLVGHWQFNEGADNTCSGGEDACDSTTNGNDLTINNGDSDEWSATYPALFGNMYSIDLDGNDYLTVTPGGGELDMEASDDFSISAWVYANDLSSTQNIVIKRMGGTGYRLQARANDEIRFLADDGTDEYRIDTTDITTGSWYHIAVVWDDDSAAETRVYVNGADDTDNTVGTIGDVDDLTNGGDFAVGATDSGGNTFDGMIDDVRVYKKALSAAEVDTLYNDNVDTDGDGTPDIHDDDDDGDMIFDVEEDKAPGGDGNGDGLQDSLQSEVGSVENSVAGGTTTIEIAGACANIEGFTVLAEDDLASQDPDFDFPLGLNDFTLDCEVPGDSSTVTVFYDEEHDTSDWDFRKFGTSFSSIADEVTFGTDTVDGETVTTASYTVTDGGSLDTDGAEDGSITDPAGAAVPALADTGFESWQMLVAGLTMLTTVVLVGRLKVQNN